MNLNNRMNLTYIRLPPRTGTSLAGYLMPRTSKEKKEILQKCKEEGKEENLDAVCNYCVLPRRRVAKKQETDPHYGCTKNCCLMLHYWDMCETCIQAQHFPGSIQTSDPKTFQRVFSKLPEDIQHIIVEYVPQVFKYVKKANRLLVSNLLPSMESKLKHSTRQAWSAILNELKDVYAVDGLSSRLSRKKICEKTKECYKNVYNTQTQPIREEDFWTHQESHIGISRNIKLIDALNYVQNIY